MAIQVLEGDAPDPKACSLLGKCRITDLPPDLPKGSMIEVTYAFDAAGRIVAVEDVRPEVGHAPGVQEAQAPAREMAAVERPEQTNMINRIARAAKAQLGAGKTSIQIRLHPPQLGNLRLDLALRGDTLRASIQTDTQGARHLIASSLPQLKAALASQGVRVDQFDVFTSGEGGVAHEHAGESRDRRSRPKLTFAPEEESAPMSLGVSGDMSSLDMVA